MAKTTIIKEQVSVYKIRHVSGTWADITVDVTGRLSVASDYGSWSHYWPNAGGKPFREFLASLNMEYVARKFGVAKVFYPMQTLRTWTHEVAQAQKDMIIDKRLALEILDEIRQLEGVDSEHAFVQAVFEKKKLMKFYDYMPELSRDIDMRFREFWNTLWKELLQEFKKEQEVGV